jgi:hypothetical protein
MTVRCPNCDRLSRDEVVCEWCRAGIPPEARHAAKSEVAEEGEGDLVAGASVALADDESAPSGVGVEEQPLAPPATGEAEAEVGVLEELTAVEELEERQERDTRVIFWLILAQLALTLYLGRLSWWSATGFAWLVVAYGVKEREMWALALPLVLFTLDIALLLFGIGPRERAGFPDLGPLDFLVYVLRMGIWVMIGRLKDELA